MRSTSNFCLISLLLVQVDPDFTWFFFSKISAETINWDIFASNISCNRSEYAIFVYKFGVLKKTLLRSVTVVCVTEAENKNWDVVNGCMNYFGCYVIYWLISFHFMVRLISCNLLFANGKKLLMPASDPIFQRKFLLAVKALIGRYTNCVFWTSDKLVVL